MVFIYATVVKYELKDICIDLGLDSKGYKEELIERIWNHINNGNSDVLKKVSNKLLAGRTSVKWYSFGSHEQHINIKNIIRENVGFNPFEERRQIDFEELTSDPVLVCGATGEKDNHIYLRFFHKSSNRRINTPTGSQIIPEIDAITAFVDEEKNIIEVRTDSRKSSKIATALGNLLKQNISLEERNPLSPFGENVATLAERLNGRIIETTSKPEELIEEFTEEKSEAVVKILDALQNYFRDYDLDKLGDELSEAEQEFDKELVTTPFAAIILSRMEKLGLGVTDRDLRELPLYKYLEPYLQHQGGYIAFECELDGVKYSFNINVGLTTKSVYFMNPATEEILEFVRECIFS